MINLALVLFEVALLCVPAALKLLAPSGVLGPEDLLIAGIEIGVALMLFFRRTRDWAALLACCMGMVYVVRLATMGSERFAAGTCGCFGKIRVDYLSQLTIAAAIGAIGGVLLLRIGRVVGTDVETPS